MIPPELLKYNTFYYIDETNCHGYHDQDFDENINDWKVVTAIKPKEPLLCLDEELKIDKEVKIHASDKELSLYRLFLYSTVKKGQSNREAIVLRIYYKTMRYMKEFNK